MGLNHKCFYSIFLVFVWSIPVLVININPLHNPIAKIMGISPEEFTKAMYKNNSNGDWMEFAPEAVKLKWVGQVIDGAIEQSLRGKSSPMPTSRPVPRRSVEQIDEDGIPYMLLPRLRPYDMYYLFNPDKYYRYAGK